ncbi:MAG TPA: hypothetical protein VMF89_04445, partial [Polyangiales bacterium]|nr:hypothetical protein [Polyangiales bacterium]
MQIRFALWAPMLALSLLPPSYARRVELANIAVSGCEQLDQGGVCELKAGQDVVVWHEGPERLETYVPDARAWISHPAERVGAGQLFRVSVRAGQRSLRLRFGARAQQLLQLRAAVSWPWLKQVEAADNVAAREQLKVLANELKGDERAFALYELARREYRTAQRAQAAEHLQAAAVLAQQLGRTSLARSAWALLANHASAAHDFAASKAALARAEQLAEPARNVI